MRGISEAGKAASRLALALAIALLCALVISLGTASADTNVSEDISTDTVWDLAGSPYIVTGNIRVYYSWARGPTLTIEPGVVVKFAEDASLQIGSGSYLGKLIADGEPGNKITFTGTAATPGWWRGIRFEPGSHDSIIDNAIVEYGGHSWGSNIYLNGASPTISDSIIRNSSGYGILFGDDSSPTLTGNQIDDNGSYPIRVDPQYAGFVGHNTYSGNNTDAIAVGAGNIMYDATWIDPGIPYIANGNITVSRSSSPLPTLTIEPGVVVKFQQAAYLQIKSGNLVADGEPGNKITFTGTTATPGWCRGILFEPNTQDSSIIDNAIVEYGGYSCESNIYLNRASPTISNSIIRHSSGYGIRFEGDLSPKLTGNQINDNGSYPIRVDPQYAGFVGSNTYSGNNPDAIEVVAGNIMYDATWIDPGIPYIANGNITVSRSSSPVPTLTIEPGVVVKFPENAYLQIISGKVVADGEPGNKITFTGTTATPGWCRGILFEPNTQDSSIIDNAIVEYGGYSCESNIYLNRASPTISNSIIRHSSGYGIRFEGDLSPKLTGNQINDNGSYPIRVDPQYAGFVGSNTYSGNNPDAIEVGAGNIMYDATWIDPGIPYIANGNITVSRSSSPLPTLTIEPGVVVKFQQATYLQIGSGNLVADGEPGNKITFTGTTATPGWWRGITFEPLTQDSSIIDNAIVEYGGYSWQTNIYVNRASPTISKSDIRHSSQYGIRCYGRGAMPLIICNRIIGNTHGVYSESNADPTIEQNNIQNNTAYGVYNASSNVIIDAEKNWWGDPSGPGGVRPGTGDAVSDYVDYDPWVTAPSPCATGDTGVDLVEKISTQSTLTETILSQKVALTNVSVSGDLNGNVSFTNFEIVKITTGSFAGKGFAKGDWTATLDGTPYEGSWKGMHFLNPSERKIYLKGAISGEVTGIAEGYLTESVNGSDVYDQYQATWKLNRVGGEFTSATINLDGTLTYEQSIEYPSTEIYLLQTCVEGTSLGYYSVSLTTVLTHLRVVSQDNPYYGEGFSIISYISDTGSGEGWTYDQEGSPGIVELKGLFTSPLLGVASAILDETETPRTVTLTMERIDFVYPPPAADLEVRTWGPYNVSPGQTIDYIIEYRNQGFRSAEDVVVVDRLPGEVEYVSNTGGETYRWDRHEVFWKLGTLPPGSKGYLSTRARVIWGLEGHRKFENFVSIATASDEYDFYIQPELLPLFDIQEYLDYQPIEIDSLEILTHEEVVSTLADENFLDLYRYAEELGFDYTSIAFQITFNEDSALTLFLMTNPELTELILVTKVSDPSTATSLLIKSTENTASIFDRQGGVSYDKSTDSLDYWGEWAPGSCPSTAQCFVNCLWKQFPGLGFGYILGQFINLGGDLLDALWSMKDCLGTLNCYGACTSGWNCLQYSKASDYIQCLDAADAACRGVCQAQYDACWESFWSFLWGLLKVPGIAIDVVLKVRDCYLECEDPSNPEYSCTPCQWVDHCASWSEKFWYGGDVVSLHCDENCLLGGAWGAPGVDKVVSKCPEDKICVNGICQPRNNDDDHPNQVIVAGDPNAKYGPEGYVLPGQKLDYKVEFENVGEGIAFGVYFTDVLDEDLDDSTLEIGPVIDVKTESQIAEPGTYNPNTRTITWFVGEVGPAEGGYANLSVNVRSDAPDGTEIINFGTVYFPSVPEITPTNGIVSMVPYRKGDIKRLGRAADKLTIEWEPFGGGQYTVQTTADLSSGVWTDAAGPITARWSVVDVSGTKQMFIRVKAADQ